MECIYDVTLINRSPQLDLRQDAEKIAGVIRETLDLRPEVTRCDVVQIDQHKLVLSVEETGTFWHGVIGRKIANDASMWRYRCPDHLSQMFRWTLRSASEPTEPEAIDPQDASAWCNKGVSLAGLGRHGEALKCYDKALAIDPGGVAAWYYKGERLYLLRRFEEAMECFDEALAICPGLATGWRTKGYSLAALGRREEALGCFDKVLAIDPQDAAAWENKGASLHALGRSAEGLECCEKALAIEPALVTAWHGKGLTLYAMGRYEETLGCFDKALTINPQDAAAWRRKALSLNALERHEEALECYDKCLAIDPRDAAAWRTKGSTLAVLGRHEEALGCYDKVLAIDPQSEVAWHRKGNSLAALGRPEEALECYDKALAINPGLATELGVRPHEELSMKDDSAETRIYKALVALLRRGTEESFVIIEEPRSRKFVQFDNGLCLGMDVPCVALTSAEVDRASQLFKALGEEYPREYHDLDAKTGKINHGATFYHKFGKDARGGARAAMAVLVNVYGLPADVELSMVEH